MPDMPDSAGDRTYLGTVSLLTVISDKGYFCSARVIHGFDKNMDADAMKQVREWQFEPAKKHGQAIPVVVQIDIQYWQDKEGKTSSVTTNAPKLVKASAP